MAPNGVEAMDRLLSMKQIQEIIALSRTQIDRYVHDPDYEHLGFPKPVKIGFRVFWVSQEVHDWVSAQIAKREAS